MFALAADTRIFADGPFRFGLNEVPIGLFVPTYAIELARSAVPSVRLTDLVVHGRVISPQEALSLHVAEAVVAPASLLSASVIRARELATISGSGYATTKRLVRGPGAAFATTQIEPELEGLVAMFR